VVSATLYHFPFFAFCRAYMSSVSSFLDFGLVCLLYSM
jgi:hypothetical protein